MTAGSTSDTAGREPVQRRIARTSESRTRRSLTSVSPRVLVVSRADEPSSLTDPRLRAVSLEEFTEADLAEFVRSGIATVVAAGDAAVTQACAQVLANSPQTQLALAVIDGEATDESVTAALAEPAVPSDALEVNGQAALSGLGLDSAVLQPPRTTGLGAALGVLRRLVRRPPWTTVHVDGVQRAAGRLCSVVVANRPTLELDGALHTVAPDADSSDGQLDVLVVPSGRELDRLRTLFDVVLGRPPRLSTCEVHRGAWVHIRSTAPRSAQLDGIELVGGSGNLRVFDVHVLPAAVRLHPLPVPEPVVEADAEPAPEPDAEPDAEPAAEPASEPTSAE